MTDPFEAFFGRPFPALGFDFLQRIQTAAAVHDGEKEFVASFDVPGFALEDLTLTLDDGRLRVRGVSSGVHAERKVDFLVEVPRSVDEDSVQAELAEGVLVVTFAKHAERSAPITITKRASTTPAADEAGAPQAPAASPEKPVETPPAE